MEHMTSGGSKTKVNTPLTIALKIALYLLIVVAYLCLWQRFHCLFAYPISLHDRLALGDR